MQELSETLFKLDLKAELNDIPYDKKQTFRSFSHYW